MRALSITVVSIAAFAVAANINWASETTPGHQEAGAHDLTGTWDGGTTRGASDFGEVKLKDTKEGYIGTYTATYDGRLGSVTFKRGGPRTYRGLFWNSNLRRYGSLQLDVADDGLSISLTWKALDNNYRLKGGESTWKRVVVNPPKDGKVIKPDGPLSTASIKDLLQEPPIVALWRHGLHRPSRPDEAAPPNLRIAIWNDGRVLSAQDPGKWGHTLELGRLTDDTLSKIKKQILDTGVFDLKGRLSYLVPSAPVFRLLVQVDGKRRLLCWDECEMSGYGANTNPTPEYLAFKKAWKSVNKLMVSTIPDDSVQVLERFETVPGRWYVKENRNAEKH